VWTEADDKEIVYGRWHRYTAKTTLAEDSKVRPPVREIWPSWADAVPMKLRGRLGSPAFEIGKVRHRSRTYYASLYFDWRDPHILSELEQDRRHLPVHAGGVYRVFAPNVSIDRCCGKDPTGTLYLGCAGTKRNWSNLRTRINAILKKEHHALSKAGANAKIKNMFPWNALAIQWAYFGDVPNYKGKEESAAYWAERWLLRCYRDSFGENPPWNEKG
jgi:hypothetical protein